jgi:RyR domain
MTAEDAAKLLDGLVERLAAIEHERWSHWQRYMHGKATKQPDGSLLVSPELVQQWERQLSTPYSDLTEKEKESDREQVRKYLPTLVEALSKK